jgi:hypothetical protein
LLILLPAGVLGLLWLAVTRRRDPLGLTRLSRRGTLVVAYLGLQALLDVGTELTSIGRHFTRSSLIVYWTALLIVLVVATWPDIKRAVRNAPVQPRLGSWLTRTISRIGTENVVWLTVVAFILGVLGYLGWSFLPSNGDSLVYHLVRVVHWIQDQSVGPFSTHYLAQIELSPLAEFNLAHFHLLVGSDRLDAYVQLVACIICLVAVSEIARLLGGSTWTQVVAVVICATVPSGILAATSTENDYFAAAAAIGLLVIALGWPSSGPFWCPAVLLGLGAGLGYMAKGTVLLLIGPAVAFVLLVHIARMVRARGLAGTIWRWLGILGAAGAAVIVVAAPFVAENVSLFGGPDGPVTKTTLSVDLTPNAAAANVVRSVATNFMMGNGTNGIETDISGTVLSGLHQVFDQLHVSPSDSAYVLGTNTNAFAKANYTEWDRSGDSGADPWDVVLICFALVALIASFAWGNRRRRMALVLAVGLALGFLLFTATARWSVFAVRYEIPQFVAWSPVIAIALSSLPKMVVRVVLCFLVIMCVPQLFQNIEEPFFHQEYAAHSLVPYFLDTTVQQYAPVSASRYEATSAAIAATSCQRVALANWIFAEYPLWAGLKDAGWQGEIQDIDVDNVTRRFEDRTFDPCVSVRQEPSGYVATDTSKVQLRFGLFALSVDPDVAGSLRLNSAHFTSDVVGVRVLPGGGWALAPHSGEPTLVRPGSIFLFSAVRRAVRVEVQSSSTTAAAHVVLSAPTAGVGPIAVSSGAGITMVLPRGITEIRLNPMQTAGAVSPKVTGVAVVPAPRA